VPVASPTVILAIVVNVLVSVPSIVECILLGMGSFRGVVDAVSQLLVLWVRRARRTDRLSTTPIPTSRSLAANEPSHSKPIEGRSSVGIGAPFSSNQALHPIHGECSRPKLGEGGAVNTF